MPNISATRLYDPRGGKPRKAQYFMWSLGG
jgi:hypothetical protein